MIFLSVLYKHNFTVGIIRFYVTKEIFHDNLVKKWGDYADYCYMKIALANILL
jgi:hypothetical protein